MILIDSDVVFVSPNNFTIPARSEFGFELIYRPLLAREESSKVTIKSPELGDFIYPLKLTGSPSTSSRTLNFKTNLGTEQTNKFKFVNYAKKQVTFTCRVEKIG